MMISLLIFSILSLPVQGNSSFAANAEDVIIEMALESIHKNYPKEHYRFQLSPRWIPNNIRKLEPEIIEDVVKVGPVDKYTNFQVVYQQNSSLQRAEVQLKIKAEQKVPVTSQRLQSGERIAPNDLEWKWVQIDIDRDKPISSKELLIGKTLRKTINAGQFISSDNISSPFMIEAGDNIQMIYEENGLQIVLGCESRQAGTKGEEIQIYCKETRKKYTAEISGPGKAVWVKTQ